MQQVPFYDPLKSYDENYTEGPFGAFADPETIEREGEPTVDFLGNAVYLPFGIPAGPLINAKYVAAAFRLGYDLCVYKTVRTHSYPCHPWPNVLAVHPGGELAATPAEPLVADRNYSEPLSITNSFGVPSKDPDHWQPDMQRAVAAAQTGQVLIGSFQGTSDGSGNTQQYIDDFVLAARLVKETGAPILEVNLSCPNEGTAHLLCFDVERTTQVVAAIKNEIGDTPLIIKTAYFENDENLRQLIQNVGPMVQGIASINTIAATIIDEKGLPALPGKGRERSGVCGDAIRWAGLDMVARLASLREELNVSFAIIGVGGVMRPEHVAQYRQQGADAVMSATGAMWNPNLAQEIWQSEQSTHKE
jgi:dihydroorotate dehydrogenase (NAD+) catalytic subunit